jgi:hypothetical protein
VVCGGLADIYRTFTFGSTMTLVRRETRGGGEHPNTCKLCIGDSPQPAGVWACNVMT